MTIASEKVRLATERFLLVRMNPARYILPVLNAGVYEITLPFIINRVERNGVPIAKVSATPLNPDEWFQDESTGLLQVNLASPPDDTSNVLVVFHYLFYTGTIFRAISEDPADPATPIRDWQPRIQNYPSILQSIDGIYNGVFTINDTQIVLINEDRNFQNNLGDDDSFFNKQVDVWLCINDVSNIQKIFTGSVNKISIAQNTVSITCADTFNRLKSKATMGDAAEEIYFSEDGFPDVVDKDVGKPCRFILGNSSRYGSRIWATGSGGAPDQYTLDECNEAVCISSAEVGTSNNRVWGACRIAGSLKIQNIGTIDDVVNISGAWGVKFSSISNVVVGDTFKFNNGGDQYGNFSHVGSFTFGGNPYDAIIDFLTTPPNIGDTVTNLVSFGLAIKDPVNQAIQPSRLEYDFTLAQSATSGGNTYIEITFANNFESHYSFGTLEPAKHVAFYRASNDAAEKHGDALALFANKVGLPVNTASITAANAALDVYVQFSIPYFDEQDYDTYLKYSQDILSSTLGFLKINADFEAEYNLLEAPTSTDIRDKFLTLNESTSVDVEYQDIKTQIIAYNPHNASIPATSVTPSPSETRDKPKSKYLHGIENVTRFRHVLETITDRIDAHANLKSERFARYKFATATQDIDSEIDTDVQLENDIILGTTKIKDVKIITIDKAPKLTSIEASDLKGL